MPHAKLLSVRIIEVRHSIIEIPRPSHLAKVDRIPPPKLRRDETKMHYAKLLGQGLMARNFDCQVAELQIRTAVLNGYTSDLPSLLYRL